MIGAALLSHWRSRASDLERYAPAAPADLTVYDQALRGFRLDQRMSELAWSKQATGRVRGPESLMGRHVLREVLQARGFGLK